MIITKQKKSNTKNKFCGCGGQTMSKWFWRTKVSVAVNDGFNKVDLFRVHGFFFFFNIVIDPVQARFFVFVLLLFIVSGRLSSEFPIKG